MVSAAPSRANLATSLARPAASGARRAVAAPLLVALVAFLLVRWTMMPGVAFWDTGEFQTVAPVLGTAHPTGFPTYVILGWIANAVLAPFGEPAFRMNLFSGLSVAAAAGLTAVLVRRLTGSTAIAVATGIGLAATPLVWDIGTHADPHALHLAFVALLLVLLVGWDQERQIGDARSDRWLIAAAFVFGLSAGNHGLTFLLAPPIGLYVLAVHPGIVRRPRLIVTCAAVLAATLVLVYLELPIRAGLIRAPLVYADPATWNGFWYVALGQQFTGLLSTPFADLPEHAANLVAIATRELGLLALLLPAAFIATVWRNPRYALLTGLAALITCFFNAYFHDGEISRYYLGPVLLAWTWLAILAVTVVETVAWVARRWLTVSSDASLSRWLAVALSLALLAPTAATLPARAQAADQSHNAAAQEWLTAALAAFEPDAVIVSWWSYSTPLWYAQRVEGLRPDIMIIDDRTLLDMGYQDVLQVIPVYLGQRPVYLIRASPGDVGHVSARFTLEPLVAGPASNVYRILGPVRNPA
jgi:hypothetical protein